MATGREFIGAVVKGTTWGTAVSVNAAAAGLVVKNINDFLQVPEQLLDAGLGLSNYKRYFNHGQIDLTPPVIADFRYTGALHRLLTYAIGDDVAAQVAATADYDHTMDVQLAPALFGTVVITDGVAIREIPSYKPMGFTLRGESGGFWEIEIRGRGDLMYLAGDAGITNASFSSVTASSNVLKASFGSAEFLINTESAGALASPADRLCPNLIELTFDRDQPPQHTACGGTDGTSDFTTQEPIDDGFLTAQLRVTFPEHVSGLNTLHQQFRAETTKKASLTITGPATGEGAQTYTSTWSFPSMRIINFVANPEGPGLIPVEITFELLQAAAAPTGMTGITNVLRHVLRDQVTSGYDT